MPVMMTSRGRTANLLFNVIRTGTPETNTPKKNSSKFPRLTRYYPIPTSAHNTISSVMPLSGTTVRLLGDLTLILVLRISLATSLASFSVAPEDDVEVKHEEKISVIT